MQRRIGHGNGHHGRTHDATKFVPIMKKRPVSNTRKYVIPDNGYIRAFIGDAAKKIAKKRHRKKSRAYHKKLCKAGE
ncbi:hypothetical protein D3C71_1160920 [compost metagenome]